MGLELFSTKELVEELRTRQGVKLHYMDEECDGRIDTNEGIEDLYGPLVILEIQDY